MTTAPSPGAATHPNHRVAGLTRWSLLMVPIFVVVWTVLDVLSLWVLELLDLHEGDLFLMQRGFAGWATQVLFFLVAAIAPVVGVWLAVAALRGRGKWHAWVGLVLNALAIVLLVYVFIDAIHLTYYPGGWLWFAE